MRIKIKKLNPAAIMPKYALPGDAGLDLYSLEDAIIRPGGRKLFNLGFALEFENGFAAIIKDKSGMALNGIHTMGGVFDAGYRGEYNVQLINLERQNYQVSKGDKIAQLIIFPITIAELVEANELTTSARNDGRFGSTGK